MEMGVSSQLHHSEDISLYFSDLRKDLYIL